MTNSKSVDNYRFMTAEYKKMITGLGDECWPTRVVCDTV